MAADDIGLLLVLADAALVLTGKGITLRAESLQRLQCVLLAAMTSAAPVAVRADLGSALGRIGDPRFRSDRWSLPDEELLGFIEVEGVPHSSGSTPSQDPMLEQDERAQHSVDLPSYFVSRYPVTVGQFRAFVEDAQFQVGHPAGLREVSNHPIRWVSFYEALAYGRWLTGKLKEETWTPAALSERLAEGWAITLPSEAEWEKAARGADGRIYPWGHNFDALKANCGENGLGTTSAVGLFPGGVSPVKCLDMSGNVCEWTRSLWGKDDRTPSQQVSLRHRKRCRGFGCS
jgi:formylglycine-generating enzyme required for sulfatase activity